MLENDSLLREMPSVDAEYLVDELGKMGVVSRGFSGLTPITWQDVAAYQSQNHNLLNSWECECLIDCSRAYVSQYNSKDSEPPYVIDAEALQEEAKKAEVARFKKAWLG